MKLHGNNGGDWWWYQKKLKKKARRRTLVKRLMLFKVYLVLVMVFFTGSWIFANRQGPESDPLKKIALANYRPELLVKEDLPPLLGGLDLNLLPVKKRHDVVAGENTLSVETSIDATLQRYILKLLRRSLTVQAAVVILRPDNGEILAMANYKNEKSTPLENLTLKANFPAASLFKIVSAAAVIEARGFTPDRPVVFRGKKHTLYRRQLKSGQKRYIHKTSFRTAFSSSINPVFGKIGIYQLGRDLISEYADKFLFNRPIPFDLPLAMSTTLVPEDAFGLAEIASGFNKRTLISPLHASLITAAVANNGTMYEPWLVRRVKDESGKILYRARRSKLAQPIEKSTAQNLRVLMEDTVRNGTLRKAFRPLRRKKIFRNMDLGAKTGTINDRSDRFKYDWVTAYVLPPHRERGISITVLAVHGKKLGIRAKDLARYIINYYFTSRKKKA